MRLAFGVWLASNLLLSFLSSTYALEKCKNLIPDIRKAHYYYFGVDFPYWYSVAQAHKESLCRHNVMSLDGIGSEGFAQITYQWWKDKLAKEGIHEIKSITNHARAQAYINYYYHKQNPCNKLWATYQAYNGGTLVFKEIERAKSCNWEDAKKVCRRKDVCVWQTPQGCKQYRNACDINYEYSLKIHQIAQKYRIGTDSSKYPFW